MMELNQDEVESTTPAINSRVSPAATTKGYQSQNGDDSLFFVYVFWWREKD